MMALQEKPTICKCFFHRSQKNGQNQHNLHISSFSQTYYVLNSEVVTHKKIFLNETTIAVCMPPSLPPSLGHTILFLCLYEDKINRFHYLSPTCTFTHIAFTHHGLPQPLQGGRHHNPFSNPSVHLFFLLYTCLSFVSM